MPTYAYRCNSCQYEFEIEARMTDAAPTQGPRCTGPDCQIQKMMTPVMGWVKGSASKNGATGPTPKAPVATPAAMSTVDDAVHLCSKYCDHH